VRERFVALDAIRGVAALAVVCLHFSFGAWPQHGYLAVDVFFVLSGFVMAHAYEEQLRSGMNVGRFALVRAVRLYPLVLLGVLMAVVIGLGLMLLGLGEPAFNGWQVLFAMLLLPYVSAGSLDMFLVLSPTWSLFNELVVNVLYAAVARFLSNRTLCGVLVVSGLILFPATVIHGSVLFGPFRGTLLMGLVRTIYSFSFGVLLYRFRSHNRLPGWLILPLGSIVIALFTPGDIRAYDAVVVTFVIPAIIATAAHTRLDRLPSRIGALAGELSYPVYILHWPLRTVAMASGLQAMLPLPAFLPLSLVGVCIASYAALKLYDEPMRRHLMKSLRAKPGAAIPASAP
jgi:peptidoglycan/LPS O-acetylase OafA/YrhL